MNDNWQIIIVALIAGLPGIIAAFAAFKGNKKIDTVHELVNSRLTEATDGWATEKTRNNLLQELLLGLNPEEPKIKKLVNAVTIKNGKLHEKDKDIIKSGDAVVMEKKI